MAGEWIETARNRLFALRGAGGWSYRPGTSPAVEPTVLACLGLRASGSAQLSSHDEDMVRSSADWLTTLQRPDGFLGVSTNLPEPGWTTPYGVLLWAALGLHRKRRERATAWLLRLKGETLPIPTDRVVGHDTTLTGWPWVADTASWLEPTALAVLALRREGYATNSRVRDGLRLIRDRAIASGGWNYGNNVVYGRSLRPQPAPTGLALLALAGVDDRTAAIARALHYLQQTLPKLRAVPSLCWGLLGLRAWGEWPEQAERLLAEAARETLRGPATAPRLAYLLLAAGNQALELLGSAPSNTAAKGI